MKGCRSLRRSLLSRVGKPARFRFLKASVLTDWLVPESRSGLETTFKGKTTKRAGDVLVLSERRYGVYRQKDHMRLAQTSSTSGKFMSAAAAPGTGNKDTYPHKIISTPFVGEPGTHLIGDISLHRPVRFEEAG